MIIIIIKIHFPDAPDQKWGVQNDRLDKVYKMEQDKIPQRSPQKDEDFVHVPFFIFKLLSHNFLNDRWGDFQFY